MESTSPYFYFDHAATTELAPQVLETLIAHYDRKYGNPSSTHRGGVVSRTVVEAARASIADMLGAAPNEIYFTSGGTESNNMALRGIALANQNRARHIITTSIEHHAIGHTCEQLVNALGCTVTYVPVDHYGVVDPDAIGRAITRDTCLISVMYANNEIGTIEPIDEIGRIAYRKGIAFHTDAVQAAHFDLNVKQLKVDSLSLSGHKFYGPKGIGILYVRDGVRLLPTQTGGGQERGMRAGTENVASIVAIAKALQMAQAQKENESARLTQLRDQLIKEIISSIPDTKLTGHPTQRLPNNASFIIKGVNGADIVRELDLAGVAASSGSACTSCNGGKKSTSHVLRAIGYDENTGQGSLRLSLGKNKEEDIRHVVKVLPEIIAKLRGGKHASNSPELSNAVQPAEQSTAYFTSVHQPIISVTHDAGVAVAAYQMQPKEFGVTASEINTAGCSCGGASETSDFAYVLGQLGYDFGSEANQDSFTQLAGTHLREPQEMLRFIYQHPAVAANMTWTLSLDATVVYAIQPDGPFASLVYERLKEYLAEQLSNGVERVSIPGVIKGSVRLLNGQQVPIIYPDIRGMYAWSTDSLIQVCCGVTPKFKPAQLKHARKVEGVRNFLDRVYYEVRNLGTTAQQRALNFTATNAFYVSDVYNKAIAEDMKLDSMDVERSPICRPGSDCWDVKLVFFNPAKRTERARHVHRFTIDVSEVIPVTIGKARHWDIY